MKRLLLLLTLMLTLTPMTQAGGPSLDAEKGPVIRYYPNPIRNVLNLEVELEYANQFKSIEVKVVNLLGQEMVPATFKDIIGLSAEVRVDLTDVPAGVYFLEVYSFINGNSVKQTRKITKS